MARTASNVFEYIPESFFMPLSCSNRQFYADCILALQEQVANSEDGVITKEDAFYIIQKILDAYGGTVITEGDEDDPDYRQESLLDRPLAKDQAYRKLLRCGWLVTEPSEDGRSTVISLPDYAEEMTMALTRIATPKKIYLGGYTRSIQEALSRVGESRHPYREAFYSAWENTRTLGKEIRHIRSSMREELDKIVDPANGYAKAMELYREYLDRALSGDLRKLQIDEGITAQISREIAKSLEQIQYDDALYDSLVEDVLDFYPNIHDQNEAAAHLAKCIDTIYKNLCCEMEARLDRICAIQTKYQRNASMKISMCTTDEHNLDSTINSIVMHLGALEDEELDDLLEALPPELRGSGLFWTPGVTFLDEESLYKPRARSQLERADALSLPEETPLAFDATDSAVCSNRYSVQNLNDWSRTVLAGRESICSEELQIDSREAFEQLVAAVINGDDEGLDYRIDFDPERPNQVVNGCSIPYFTLRRREIPDVAAAVQPKIKETMTP